MENTNKSVRYLRCKLTPRHQKLRLSIYVTSPIPNPASQYRPGVSVLYNPVLFARKHADVHCLKKKKLNITACIQILSVCPRGLTNVIIAKLMFENFDPTSLFIFNDFLGCGKSLFVGASPPNICILAIKSCHNRYLSLYLYELSVPRLCVGSLCT